MTKEDVNGDSTLPSIGKANDERYADGSHCFPRRMFLVRAGAVAGSLLLGSSGSQGEAADKDDSSADVVVKLKDHAMLKRVGSFEVITLDGAGKVLLAQPEEGAYVACSAICTHKGGQLAYEHDSKQLVCPRHGARFDLQGNVVKGPAQQSLPSYTADSAVIVAIKPAT